MPVRSVTLRVLGDDKGAITALDNVDRKLAETIGLASDLEKKLLALGAMNVKPTVDVGGIAAAMAEVEALKAALAGLHGETDVGLLVSGAAGRAGGGGQTVIINDNTRGGGLLGAIAKNTGDTSADAMMQTDLLAQIVRSLHNNFDMISHDLLSQMAILRASGGSGSGGIRRTIIQHLSDPLGRGDGGGGGGGGGFWGFGKPIPVFAGILPGILATVGGFHLLVDTIIEVAAVVIPATIALAAFGIAGASAARDIYGNFRNAEIAITAVGGNLPALGGGFASIQAAVKPQVFTLFGEALSLINNKTGEFGQLATGAGNALIQFVNRGVTAFENSGLTGFASKAVTDLNLLFHILGNLGGIVGNLLRGVPGVANVLFSVIDKATGALESFTGGPVVQGIERMALGLHGAFLWGGLLATGLIALASPAGRVVNWLRSIDSAGNALGEGKGLLGLLGKLASVASSPWTWVAIGIAALASLVFAFGQVRNATQQWIAQQQGLVDNASVFDKMNVLHKAILNTDQKLIPATHQYAQELGVVGTTIGSGLNPNLQKYVSNINNLGGAQKGFISEQTRLNALFNTLGTRFNLSRSQILNFTVAMTGSQKEAAKLWNEYAKGQYTLKQLVNEYYSYILATTGMVPTTAAARAALYALDKVGSDTATAINNVTTAESKLLAMSTNLATSQLGVAAVTRALGRAADAQGASWTGVNKASNALQTQFESNFIPSVNSVYTNMKIAGANSHQLAQVISTDLLPAVDAGALKNRQFRDQIYQMATEANYHGVNSIRALTSWMDRNKVSAQEAARIIRILGANIDNLKSKSVGIHVTGQGTWNVQGLPGSLSAHVHGTGPSGGAAGMYVHQGTTPTADNVLVRVSRGELIVPAHMVRAGAVDHLRGSIPGFGMPHHSWGGHAAGGLIHAGDYSGIPSNWPSTQMSVTLRAMEASVAKAVQQGIQNAARTFSGGLGRSGLRGLESLWMGAGGPGGGTAHVAAAIALAESGGNPNAYNASGASGLWQILGAVYPGNLFNPRINALNAVIKYRDAGGFSPWVTYTSGAYLQFMDHGGVLHPGLNTVYNGTGRNEIVSPPNMSDYGGGGSGEVHLHVHVQGLYDPDKLGRQLQQVMRRHKTHMGGKDLGL